MSPSPACRSARCSAAPEAEGRRRAADYRGAGEHPRYRCDGCGNVTRFDVTVSQKTTAFYHYTVGGELVIEEEQVPRVTSTTSCAAGVATGAASSRSPTRSTPSPAQPRRCHDRAAGRDPAPAPTHPHLIGSPHDDPARRGRRRTRRLPRRVDVEHATDPVLLLFLSAGCLGCRDLWEGLAALAAGVAGAARLAVVTRGQGEEDPAAIGALAAGAPGGGRRRAELAGLPALPGLGAALPRGRRRRRGAHGERGVGRRADPVHRPRCRARGVARVPFGVTPLGQAEPEQRGSTSCRLPGTPTSSPRAGSPSIATAARSRHRRL